MTDTERELHVMRLLTLIGIAADAARNAGSLAALARMSSQQQRIVPGDRMTLAKIEAGGAIVNGQAAAYERAQTLERQASGEVANILGFAEALRGILSAGPPEQESETKG